MKKILLVAVVAVMFTACGPKVKEVTKVVPKLACSNNMTEYKLADKPVQFCYDKTWGEPVVTKLEAELGTGEVVNFGKADNAKAPKLWIASGDFKPKNKADMVAKFNTMNSSIADAQKLKKQVNEAAGYDEKDISARKSDVGGVRAIRADVSGKVNQIIYYVPGFYDGNNLVISGGKDMAETMDNFIFDMVLGM